ncbi:MAG: hypothetical protein Q7J47_06900 [Azoarcus sp.]|nr:hypothetical protein [Azoarcus sp.]
MLDADLIVVGSHAGSRLGETAMGSVPRFFRYDAPLLRIGRLLVA